MLAGNVAALLSPVVFVPVLTYVFGRQNYDYESMRNIRLANDANDTTTSPHAPAAEIQTEEETKKLNRTSRIARTLTVGVTICLLVLWPMPMYGSGYVFSKEFFTGWISAGFVWLFGTTVGVVFYPLWEGRVTMKRTVKGMIAEIRGQRKLGTIGKGDKTDSFSGGTSTPVEIPVLKGV